MKGFEISRAKREDLEDALNLSLALTRMASRQNPFFKPAAESENIERRNLKKHLGSRKHLILVARKGSKTIGYSNSVIYKKNPLWKVRSEGCINAVFILPAHRRKGITAALVKTTISWMKKNKIKRVVLYANVKNKPGIKAWKSLGFKERELTMDMRI
jgi:ribosomal protein S18 acetylase RimI-like enzyme